jgi:hypothetical protein
MACSHWAGIGEVGFDEVASAPAVEHFGEEVFDVVGGAANDHYGGAFVEAGAGDGLADAGAAAGNYDDAVVKAEVHEGRIVGKMVGAEGFEPPSLYSQSKLSAVFTPTSNE